MATGKTLEMRWLTRSKPPEALPHPTPGRDRSLAGKARVRARRALNRAGRKS